MARLLDILIEILKKIEKENPFGLVAKGGTALSAYFLGQHRESEDLDFDTKKANLNRYTKIIDYFKEILEKIKADGTIKDYRITKAALASTNRLHIRLELETHKTFLSKIDVDFVDVPERVGRKENLFLYTTERMFITKLIALKDRKEFKDLYDVYFLIRKIDPSVFSKNENVMKLVDEVIESVHSLEIGKAYKEAFRNIDLRFKRIKEKDIPKLSKELIQQLRLLRNKIR